MQALLSNICRQQKLPTYIEVKKSKKKSKNDINFFSFTDLFHFYLHHHQKIRYWSLIVTVCKYLCKKLSQVIKEEFFKADKIQNKEKMLRRPLVSAATKEKKLEKKRQNKNFSNEVMLRLETVCHFMSFIPFFLRLPPLQYFLWAKKGDFFPPWNSVIIVK